MQQTSGINRTCVYSRVWIHSLRLGRDSYIHIVHPQEILDGNLCLIRTSSS